MKPYFSTPLGIAKAEAILSIYPFAHSKTALVELDSIISTMQSKCKPSSWRIARPKNY
jgi:hypothetical protein